MLSKATILDITKLHLEQFQHQVQAQGYHLDITTPAIEFIAQKGFVEEFGARPMKRAIKQYLMVPLSQHIIAYPDKKHMTAVLYNDRIRIQ